MKCEICKAKVQETFLSKPIGTYLKDEKGKLRVICNQCQRSLQSKEEQLDAINKRSKLSR